MFAPPGRGAFPRRMYEMMPGSRISTYPSALRSNAASETVRNAPNRSDRNEVVYFRSLVRGYTRRSDRPSALSEGSDRVRHLNKPPPALPARFPLTGDSLRLSSFKLPRL